MFSIILYSYKLYCCHICDISQLWSYAPGFTQSIFQKYFRSSLMLPKTYPLLSNYSTCLSPMSTLSLNWGMLLLEPLFGTPMMATLGSFPQIQIFQTFQTRSKRQNRAGNPMLLLSQKNLIFL
mgnify:CR=1 FL=1